VKGRPVADLQDGQEVLRSPAARLVVVLTLWTIAAKDALDAHGVWFVAPEPTPAGRAARSANVWNIARGSSRWL
jgi:hypothetical protein